MRTIKILLVDKINNDIKKTKLNDIYWNEFIDTVIISGHNDGFSDYSGIGKVKHILKELNYDTGYEVKHLKRVVNLFVKFVLKQEKYQSVK